MAKLATDTSSLTSVADAIRAQGSTTSQLVYPAGFVSAIKALPTVVYSEIAIKSVSKASAFPTTASYSFTTPFAGSYTFLMPLFNGFSGITSTATSVLYYKITTSDGATIVNANLSGSGLASRKVKTTATIAKGITVSVYAYYTCTLTISNIREEILGLTVYATAT